MCGYGSLISWVFRHVSFHVLGITTIQRRLHPDITHVMTRRRYVGLTRPYTALGKTYGLDDRDCFKSSREIQNYVP